MAHYYGLSQGSRLLGAWRLALIVCILLITWCFAPFRFFVPRQTRVHWAMSFHYVMRKALGFRVIVNGKAVKNRPTLYISNHSSYFDIFLLGSLIDASFIAKAEILEWPLFGTLCKMQDTLFVKREGREVGKQKNILTERLLRGDRLVLFPEGTTSDGTRTLNFNSSLFASAMTDDPKQVITVQPVSIAIAGMNGLPVTRAQVPLYAWYGDMTLQDHLWPALCVREMTVVISFHPATTNTAHAHRKLLCDYCQQYVRKGVEDAVRGGGVPRALKGKAKPRAQSLPKQAPSLPLAT